MSDAGEPIYDTPTLIPVAVEFDTSGVPCLTEQRWMILRRGKVNQSSDGFFTQTEPDYWERCNPPENMEDE